MRDNILIEQKQVIDKNRLQNHIGYDGLKEIEKITEKDVINALPPLPNNSLKAIRSRVKSTITSTREVRQSSSSPDTLQKLPLLHNRFGGQQSYGKVSHAKKSYEIPSYLKSKNTAVRAQSNSQHRSFDNNKLSYKRKLHNAIYERNTRFESRAGSASREESLRRLESNLRGYSRKLKLKPRANLNYTSQPNLLSVAKGGPFRNPNESPFVKNFLKDRNLPPGSRVIHSSNPKQQKVERFKTIPELRLLRRK